jgi:hypothetical protein
MEMKPEKPNPWLNQLNRSCTSDEFATNNTQDPHSGPDTKLLRDLIKRVAYIQLDEPAQRDTFIELYMQGINFWKIVTEFIPDALKSPHKIFALL